MDINRYSPSYGLKHRHMTDLSDYTTEEVFELLYATKSMKGKFIAHDDTRILQGVTVALLFGDTSLRTRSALEIGIRQLGGVCVELPYSQEDMRAGENVKDIVNVISRYGVGAMVTRGIEHAELREFCAVSEIPIINSTNEYGTPLQALCDLFTIWEKKGRLEGVKLAYVGKGTQTASSLVSCAVKCGMDVAVATPPRFPLNGKNIEVAMQYGNFVMTENPAVAVRGAEIVYTDGYSYHTPPTDEELKILKPYQVNGALMSGAARGAMFMHALPARRGFEVTAEIIDGQNSLVLEQGENKLHTVKAALALLIK